MAKRWRVASAGLVLVVGCVAVSGVWGQTRAVGVEVRAGAVLSTPLAEADVVYEGQLVPGGVTLRPGVAPFLGVGLVHGVDERLALEVVAAFSRGRLDGDGPAGGWAADEVSVIHAAAGLRYGWRVPWLYGRAGAGLIAYRGSDLAILRRGADTGILLVAAVGVRPARAVPVRLEVEVQGHSFGSVGLRREGGVDGRVARVLVGVVAGRGGEG